MNILIKAIVLSISTSIIAASAFAAPQDHHKDVHNGKHSVIQKSQVKHNSTKPSRDWKSGQAIPSQYRSANPVDYKRYSKLTKPGKNQQWIKVNSDYVLVNTNTHKVVKIIKR